MKAILSDWRRLTIFGLAAGAAVLGAALISQFGFGLNPCPMCIMQRWPYVAGIVAAALALFLGGSRTAAALALLVAAGAYMVSIGLGIWHSGVEFGYFAAPDCEGALSKGAISFGEMAEKGFAKGCDERDSFFLGLSMANWNVLVSIGLAALFVSALVARLKSARG
ncbi:MAG: disulfide bond formation protein B [Neomegalonema sp.]|nr:disulfide bond formation protein B [Neomegalonema sp.]